MRAIKFRGKTTDGKLVYGSMVDTIYEDVVLIVQHQMIDSVVFNNVQRETIGQFTGLLDKNGKEIYEGDILKVYYYGKSKVFGVVRFYEARFYIDDEFMRKEHKAKVPMAELFSTYQFEIIGNIHDNPELLKGY